MSRKHFLIALGIILALIIGALVWAFTAEAETTWDACYPIANANVSWGQTFHNGHWNN